MKPLTPEYITTVATSLTGARRAKFEASVRVINLSVAQGAWIPRGSVKADSGFYQGLYRSKERHPNHYVDMCLSYGRALTPALMAEFADKLTHTELAWARLCIERIEITRELDEARPLPKITPIGLSPKVTKTLTECKLDLDLSTIKMAKIEGKKVKIQARDKENRPRFDDKNEPIMVTVTMYFVVWTPGILFDKSRFAYNDCQACGKTIPSKRFVPIEATCKKLGLVALWVGCDCARNIFGIKDVGLEKT